jgi:hypothetical protein
MKETEQTVRQPSNPAYEYKQFVGWPSLLHWHCGRPMRRIVEHECGDGKITNRVCIGWSCQCGHRLQRQFEMM